MEPTLIPITVRDLWRHEANDFTPWLLGNAEVLASALSLNVEIHSSEVRVGRFALDLMGRDLTHDCVLIVENQLEPSDHSHLGQLMTYAAGTQASSIVWIATYFRQEHGRALEWLNRESGGAVRYYGVQISVSREAGAVVPQLRLVVGPDHGFAAAANSPVARQAARLAERQADDATGGMRAEFFDEVLDRLRPEAPAWRFNRRGATTLGTRITTPIPLGDIWGTFLPSRGLLRVDLHVHHPDKERNHQIFDHLFAHRDEIESEAGEIVSWDRDVIHGPGCRLATHLDATVGDTEQRASNIEWCARQVLVLAEAASRWGD